MKEIYIRKEIKLSESKLNEIDVIMRHYGETKINKFLVELIDLGLLIKKKQLENDGGNEPSLLEKGAISSLINNEILKQLLENNMDSSNIDYQQIKESIESSVA